MNIIFCVSIIRLIITCLLIPINCFTYKELINLYHIRQFPPLRNKVKRPYKTLDCLSPSEIRLESLQRPYANLKRKKNGQVCSNTGVFLENLKRRNGVLKKKYTKNNNGMTQTMHAAALEMNATIINDGIIYVLKEDEEFIAAIEEVKGAAKNVSSSVGNLTTSVLSKGPDILISLFRAVVSQELRNDFNRRKSWYISDWTDALKEKRQSIAGILFLYFACLAPVVSFGTIATQITEGSIGVVEFLLGSGVAGMLYSIFCGQPMGFVAPTGLTLAFISGLYRFCSLKNVPFLPIYTWVGLWTSFFMITLGLRGSSKLIRFCTRFTDEIFNSLLSLNFIYEAFISLRRNFLLADPMNLSMPFVSLSMALATFWSTMKIMSMQTSIYFNQKVRNLAKDFGPVLVIILLSFLNATKQIKKFGVPTLVVPGSFQLSEGRDFLVPLFNVPVATRFISALPALLLTALFFMDQNISLRVVNNPDKKLKKGEAYNIDMIALGGITALLSLFGLPWMCGATVQSMNHVKAMTRMKFNQNTQTVEVEKVTETRTTGFVIHAMLAATVGLLPTLRFLPIPVVSGVFLFIGRKLMTGNTFLKRIQLAYAERKRLPMNHPINVIGKKRMNFFTAIQITCLTLLWAFKQNSATSIFFPSIILMLIAIRLLVLPRIFSEKELTALGDPTSAILLSKS